MAEVNSAGTLVAAVLETAGYVAQANILQDFAAFFKYGGALFYVFAVIGALVSVAMFGSYRAARYLLLGPALFIFLLESRIDIGSVVWKLGGGKPRQVNDVFSTPRLDGYQPQGPVNVSRFFYWYTTVIDHFVRSITDVILTHENDQDLLMLPRRQAVSLIARAAAQKGQLAQMYHEALFGSCSRMMEYALALASPRYSDDAFKKLEMEVKREQQNGSGTPRWHTRTYERLAQSHKDLEDQLKATSQRMVDPGRALRQFIADQTSIAAEFPGKGIDYSQTLGSKAKGDPKKFVSEEVSNLQLSCGAVRQVVEDATIQEAAWFLKKIDEAALKPPLDNSDANRKLLCNTIAAKLYSNWEPNDNCSLAQAASVFMLRNAIQVMPLSGILAKHKERLLCNKGFNGLLIQDVGPERPIEERILDKRRDQEGVEYGTWRTSDGTTMPVRKIKGQWHPVSDIKAEGLCEIGFGMALRYQAFNYKQDVFTRALTIPYYQGVLLYLLSIGYPFMALLVLLPGRAQTFLVMPLFWLWVKSWDIGFAMVTVLDKILWNLLPSTELPLLSGKVQNTGLFEKTLQAEDGLRAVLGFDPSFNIHAHYNMIAMALYSVPAITGFAILRARGSILSSFTDAIDEAATDSGAISAGKEGMRITSQRSQRVINTMAAGVMSAGTPGMGLLGQGRGETAVAAMIGRSLTGAIGEAGKELSIENLSNALATGLSKGKDAGLEVLQSLVRLQGAKNFAFDPVTGRYGYASMTAQAAGQAVEASGVFEMENNLVATSLMDAELDLYRTLVTQGTAAATDAISGLLRAPIALSGVGTSLASPLAGVGGALWLGYNMKKTNELDPLVEFFDPRINPGARFSAEDSVRHPQKP